MLHHHQSSSPPKIWFYLHTPPSRLFHFEGHYLVVDHGSPPLGPATTVIRCCLFFLQPMISNHHIWNPVMMCMLMIAFILSMKSNIIKKCMHWLWGLGNWALIHILCTIMNIMSFLSKIVLLVGSLDLMKLSRDITHEVKLLILVYVLIVFPNIFISSPLPFTGYLPFDLFFSLEHLCLLIILENLLTQVSIVLSPVVQP